MTVKRENQQDLERTQGLPDCKRASSTPGLEDGLPCCQQGSEAGKAAGLGPCPRQGWV